MGAVDNIMAKIRRIPIEKIRYIVIGLLITLLIIPTFIGASTARAGEGYEMSWWTVDGGGGESIGEGYTLKGTIGQHDAGS